MRNTTTYTDIDLNFTRHPVMGDVSVKYNDDAIKAAVRNLVMTANYERPFHSEIGSRITTLLFEPITPMLWGLLKTEITNLITAYEPRVKLLDVLTTYLPDKNAIDIVIAFEVLGTSKQSTLSVQLQRTR